MPAPHARTEPGANAQWALGPGSSGSPNCRANSGNNDVVGPLVDHAPVQRSRDGVLECLRPEKDRGARGRCETTEVVRSQGISVRGGIEIIVRVEPEPVLRGTGDRVVLVQSVDHRRSGEERVEAVESAGERNLACGLDPVPGDSPPRRLVGRATPDTRAVFGARGDDVIVDDVDDAGLRSL